MSLMETLLSVGIMVPLTTLSLRIFIDAIRFGKTSQAKLERIDAIQKVQWNMLQRSPFPEIQTGKELSHYNGNLCTCSKKNCVTQKR